MTRSLFTLVVGFSIFGLVDSAAAQLPVPIPAPPGAGSGQRLPDDQIEGIVFEYKGTFKRGEAAESEVLEGKFRLEKTAIFDVGGTLRAPSPADLEKIKNKLLSGKGADIKLPQPPQQKRIGQFHKTTGDKLRLEFDDKDSMFGTMLLYHKKGTADVWHGTFAEKEGTKVVRTWQVSVRPIQD